MSSRRGQARPGRAPAPKVRLSCETCHQRKVKCDKLNPCTNCQRFGAICVPVERARLPRGRTRRLPAGQPAESEADLRDRVSKLEQLLRDLARSNAGSSIDQGPSPSVMENDSLGQGIRNLEIASPESESSRGRGPAVSGNAESQKTEPYMGNSFWADLMHQTQGLRDTMHMSGTDFLNYEALLVGLARPESFSGSSVSSKESYTSPQMRAQLFNIFLLQVDPVFKIVHRPSLSAYMLEGKPYLDYEPGHLAPAALASAVYYAASCSLSEEQCLSLFSASKEPVVAQYRKETEAALVRADFITTNDLTVLQSFVLSLAAARSQDQTRRVWTMLSMTLRIGQALSLHMATPPFPVKPFERELRRRLWHAIGLLDVQACLDRATEPMMQTSWIDSFAPENINDDDFDVQTEELPQMPESFTNMTFTLMLSKAQCAVRLLNFSDFMEPGIQDMRVRQQIILDFQQTASRLLSKFQPDVISFHWFTKQTAECIHASLQLIALRPFQRNANFTPPRVKGDRLLKLAVDVLETTRELCSDPRGKPWSWFESIFVPWHGLAVAIAELCVCEDPLLMEKYWPAVEQAHGRFNALLADSQQGMLWKPMERLMDRARAKRSDLLRMDFLRRRPLPLQEDSLPMPPTSGSVWQPPSTFASAMPENQAAPAMPMQETFNTLEPWPNVWDAIDFGATSVDNLAWSNYESFIGDVYETGDSMLTFR